ncbi:MAG: hypothetical protein JXR96_21640, partial [Deltaproteobacteria bacterium]|nr:hypothetical protein [Deltaproteobacteria bacterium]
MGGRRPGRALLVLAVLTCACWPGLVQPARAEDDGLKPDFFYAAATGIGAATVFGDVLMWGAGMQTTGASNHWAWHFVPLVGPIMGLVANGSAWDDCQGEWCGFSKGTVYAFDAFFLAGQVTALVLTGVGLHRSLDDRAGHRAPASPAAVFLHPAWPQLCSSPKTSALHLFWGLVTLRGLSQSPLAAG